MLATPFFFPPLQSFHLPRSAFSPPFLLFLDVLVVWHPRSLQWQTASRGMTFAGWIPGTYTSIPADPGRGKIRSPCKTISTIETFVTGYGSLILGTRLISERRETKLWMELTFAARRGDPVLILSNVETNIYVSFFFFFRVNWNCITKIGDYRKLIKLILCQFC